MDQPTENWVPIPGWEGAYEVSDTGSVRSVDRVTNHGRRWKGRVLRATLSAVGYKVVHLSRGNESRVETVHSLVLTAFRGIRPPGMEACHSDGVPNEQLARKSPMGHIDR
jgi:NUMOD4 motif